MRLLQNPLTASVIAVTSVFGIAGTPAIAFTLSNNPGNGAVSVGVDEFGSFGAQVGGIGTGDAYYTIGGTTAGTTFQSGVALRFGNAGGRTFLTSGSIGNGGGTVVRSISGTPTAATSAFRFGELNFQLTQSLTPIFDSSDRTGTTLTQIYTITNTSTSALAFELVRYIDGNLFSDNTNIDSSETLSETHPQNSRLITFVGITASGGRAVAINRAQDIYSGALRRRIISGNSLTTIVQGEGEDESVDPDLGYDTSLGLLNLYTLGAGQTTTYITRTFFDSIHLQPPPPTVPEPTTFLGAVIGGAFISGVWHFRKRQQA